MFTAGLSLLVCFNLILAFYVLSFIAVLILNKIQRCLADGNMSISVNK